MPTWNQISGIAERAILMLLMYLAGRGYISASDATSYAALILGILGVVWGWYVNRDVHIIKDASQLPKVENIILNDKAMADSLPANVTSK